MKKQGGWFSMAMVMVFLACFAGYFSTRLMMGPKDAASIGQREIGTLQANQTQEEAEELAKGSDAKDAKIASLPETSPDLLGASASIPAPGLADTADISASPVPQSTLVPEVDMPAQGVSTPPPTLSTVIQFGRFTTHEGGALVVAQLKAQGIYSAMSKEDVYYIVISGTYPNKESAKADVWKYKAMGIDCFVTQKQV